MYECINKVHTFIRQTYKIKYFIYVILFFIFVVLSGCNVFKFSPYDDDLETDIRNSNFKNIIKIENNFTVAEKDSFDFAIISDSHSDYDDLHDVVKWINKNPNIKFTFFLGDQTDLGLKFEFENTLYELEKLNKPYIVIIGNHDYLSQGKSIFQQIYGNTNFSFSIGNNKFIGFDNIVWENDNKRPEFEWLQNELDDKICKNIFLMMHIPEESEPMEKYRHEYSIIIKDVPNLYRLHGHTHSLKVEWPKLTTCEISKKKVPIISVRNSSVEYIIEECK
jgi:predicted phosphodiesterase